MFLPVFTQCRSCFTEFLHASSFIPRFSRAFCTDWSVRYASRITTNAKKKQTNTWAKIREDVAGDTHNLGGPTLRLPSRVKQRPPRGDRNTQMKSKQTKPNWVAGLTDNLSHRSPSVPEREKARVCYVHTISSTCICYRRPYQ